MVKPHTPEPVKNGSKYPQLNLNTGISFAGVVVLVGAVVWFTGIRKDVDNHEWRLVAAEQAIKEVRLAIESARFQQAQTESKIELRLTSIDFKLSNIADRFSNERERRPVQ